MSDSVRPHRQQPTRLPRPWDSPGKNTGVGCHFLLQCMKVKSQSEVAQSCLTLATPWTAAYQALPSMGFSRQKYWSGVPLPSPDLTAETTTNQLFPDSYQNPLSEWQVTIKLHLVAGFKTESNAFSLHAAHSLCYLPFPSVPLSCIAHLFQSQFGKPTR